MNFPIIFVAIVVAAAMWHVVATILIFECLRRRGQEVNFLLLRMMSPVYAHRYRALTIKESGKTGPFFWHWIVSINLVLIAAVAAILTPYL